MVPRERSCVIFFGLVALVLCGIRCPGGRAVEIRGGHFWCVRLPLLPDLWFWISPSGWYSRIGTQFGDEAPPGRSALALKMICLNATRHIEQYTLLYDPNVWFFFPPALLLGHKEISTGRYHMKTSNS